MYLHVMPLWILLLFLRCENGFITFIFVSKSEQGKGLIFFFTFYRIWKQDSLEHIDNRKVYERVNHILYRRFQIFGFSRKKNYFKY